MVVKDIVVGDFINYKKPSLFIIFPYCDFKCDKENGCQLCQNMPLIHQKNIEINVSDLINRYYDNIICQSLVCGGLEPMDSFDELIELIEYFRQRYNDDIVIYTGFYRDEISDKIDILKQYPNIIIKYGRFIPNQKPHYDSTLGINLASDNQYAEII